MKRTVVVDAHALLWFLEDSLKLSPDADAALSDPESRLLLPVIALAEVCWVIGKGKSVITVAELRDAVTNDARISVVPMDDDLVYAADALTGELEMHDRLIVATAAREFARDDTTVLLSADHEIHAARLVPVVW